MKDLYDIIRLSLPVLIFLISLEAISQQQPQYSQFMNAQLLYNPGYAGVSGGLNARAFGRWQWVGFEGAPSTQTFAIDSDFPNKSFGIGLSLSRDVMAITSSSNLTFNYAYHIDAWRGKLSMGLSGTLNRITVKYNEVYVLDEDVNFALQAEGMQPNFGLGLYYDHPSFWIGASLPEVLNSEFDENGNTYYGQTRHFFVSGGYRLQIAPRWRLDPSFLLKIVENSSLGSEFNVMAWIDDRVAGGIGYRPEKTMTAILQFKATKNLSLGYAFDYVVDDELANVFDSSHEVMLGLKLSLKKTDSDADGVEDKKDNCPMEFGVATNGGCPLPDGDGDGVPDEEDNCPDKAGLTDFMGCPDTDLDGIQDSDDECPSEAGSHEDGGCPDRDKDGVIDSDDACPDDPGILHGCPDSDADGVNDHEDKCKHVFGAPEYMGCPAVQSWEKKVLEEVTMGVQFESGTDKLTVQSYSHLNKIVEIMTDNKLYRLKISGYTDSSGNDEENLQLSQSRADQVKRFLVDIFGVDVKRLEAVGYGEANPIADNATSMGRAKNRRVEFELGY